MVAGADIRRDSKKKINVTKIYIRQEIMKGHDRPNRKGTYYKEEEEVWHYVTLVELKG